MSELILVALGSVLLGLTVGVPMTYVRGVSTAGVWQTVVSASAGVFILASTLGGLW